MKLGETLFVRNREAWRQWLEVNHAVKSEIWLVYHKKISGLPCIPYAAAVEEALCFGWIDSTMKTIDDTAAAQRYSPRRKNSRLSELNKERVRMLLSRGKMTKAGLESIRHHFEDFDKRILKEFIIPDDILDEIRRDQQRWNHYLSFPESYQRIRIAFIDDARSRPEVFRQRLNYFLKKTSEGKRFGSWAGDKPL
ncbi:MAG TPA: YdeI/OmpD-associated family protein [Bacteroidales bacterium]|nr:YdeI/OmpD-associated family protein [Bacteroidales bacterium]HSA42280.1 YdeI/OmpD-associated family protein [Bacteroidales bacterium]